MRWLALLIALAALAVSLVALVESWRASVPLDLIDLTPDADGVIHHPTYGDYPAEVPFKPGMDLYPGQSAIVKIERGGEV